MNDEYYIFVKYELEKRKKTVSWLSERVGVSLPYLIDILKGKRTPKQKIEIINYFLEKENIKVVN